MELNIFKGVMIGEIVSTVSRADCSLSVAEGVFRTTPEKPLMPAIALLASSIFFLGSSGSV